MTDAHALRVLGVAGVARGLLLLLTVSASVSAAPGSLANGSAPCAQPCAALGPAAPPLPARPGTPVVQAAPAIGPPRNALESEGPPEPRELDYATIRTLALTLSKESESESESDEDTSPGLVRIPTGTGPADIVPQCDAEDALFPGSLFDPEQLRHGAVILYFIFAFYGFYVIGVVCEGYFLPTVEIICDELGLTPDIAATTFMSLASSSPELFVNVVTTFLTRSTMGVGTTVGSATFNVLGLASFIGLAARAPITINAAPVLRDSIMYVVAIAVTTAVVWDGSVEWYEALLMVLLSLAFLAFMFTQRRLARWARTLLSRSNSTIVLTAASRTDELSSVSSQVAVKEAAVKEAEAATPLPQPVPDPELAAAVANQISITKGNRGASSSGCLDTCRQRVWCVFSWITWPVKQAVALTLMDPTKDHLRRFYLLNFVLCVVWIALAAYVVSWMLAVIGNTLQISDAVMGITLLAAGGSTPEAVSAIIMARKGVGSVGIANGLGANTLNMLMNLGMPWLVRSLVYPDLPWTVLSEGLPFDLVSLVSAVVVLNIVLLASRYRLCRTQGVATFAVYVLFIVLLVLIELNVFGLYHKSECTKG